MQITDYTTTNEIRALLGVSTDELEDATILQPVYTTILSESLYDIDPGLDPTFQAAIVLEPPSAAQTRFMNVASTYACYIVAQALLGSAPVFAPKRIKDDQTETDRVLNPFAALQNSVQFGLGYLKPKVVLTYEAVTTVVLIPTPIKSPAMLAPIGYDPVTGQGY
jgi:hypothetical protein